MKRREISCWLDSLKSEYTAEISQQMREDQAMNQCDYLLKKLGVIPPPIAKRLGTHISAIVVEPRNNELPTKEKISIPNNKSNEIPKQHHHKSKKNYPQYETHEIKPIHHHKKDKITYHENVLDDLPIQEQKAHPKEQKSVQNDSLKDNTQESQNKHTEVATQIQISQILPSQSTKTVHEGIIQENHDCIKLQAHNQSNKYANINEIHNEAKRSQMINEKPKINQEILQRKVNQFILVQKSLVFFRWQEKSSKVKRKEFTIATLSKLRLIRRSFKQWKARLDFKLEQRRIYEEECKQRIHSAKLQRQLHTAKIKLSTLTVALFFNKWLKRMRKKPETSTKQQQPKKVPVYLRPPDVLKRKPSPAPIIADPRAEELLKRAKESKEKKINEAKERMKQDEKEKKKQEKIKQIEQKKHIEEHKKMLEHQHQQRQKQENERIQAHKNYEKMIAEKEQMLKYEKIARNFRRKHLFSLWTLAMKKLVQVEISAVQHHEKELQKKVFIAFGNILLRKEEKQVKIAEQFRNKFLKKYMINLFKKNVNSSKSRIERAQNAIKPFIIKAYFKEMEVAYIDAVRRKEFTAQSFYEKRLLKKAFHAFPIGAKKLNEDESREKKREDLMAKALQYLHENEFKRTSELNVNPTIKLDPIEDNINEEEDSYDSDIF